MAANKILLKRGTRAQINSAKTSSALNTYEPLWVTDEGRIEMSSAANASVTIARLDDIKVTSVAGRTGDVTLSKTDVGLANVDNTSDANKPVSTATQTALNGKQPLATVLTNTTASFTSALLTKLNGIATGATANTGTVTSVGVAVPTGFSASAAITTSGTITISYAAGYQGYTTTEASKLAGIAPGATANTGTVTSVGVAVPTGFSVSGAVTSSGTIAITYSAGYQGFTTAESTKLAGIEAGAQVNTVTSVASKTGAVTLVKGDVGLGNVDNTSDASKPVSTAQQTALNSKLDLSGGTLTGDLILKGDPTAALMAATKQYVDASGGVDYQEFLTSGTWTKPANLADDAIIMVELWGAGGGGNNYGGNGRGGGGGAYVSRLFRAADIISDVSVTIGAGGTGVTGTGAAGSGGNTSFGAYLTAYGGGGAANNGGGGGGATSAGTNTSNKGGGPEIMTYFQGTTPNVLMQINYGGDAAITADLGGSSFYGGGGGSTGSKGGDSVYGGGGGGRTAGGGGTSVFGGAGGGGDTDGSVPGGGGGRRANGADGKAIVRVIR